MNLLQRFNNHVRQQQLFVEKDKLLLAVSGGIDSVVLCELCKQAGYDFTITHCNFKLRGKESERDKDFVRELAFKYGIDFFAKDFETEQYAADHKISIQEAARILRYDWFEELINQSAHPFNTYLLTAHHADDNAETVLMHFCRGTGLHGLTGIPAAYGTIRRPLLPFTRQELLAFAKENNLAFVEDSSNASSKYTRNFFRNEIIPAISKVYPQVKDNLNDNIERFKEMEKLYKLSVSDIKKKLIKQKRAEWHIPVMQLMGYHSRALIFEIFAEFGFTEKQIDEVIKLASSESGRYIDSPVFGYRIIKHRHWFIVSPVQSAASGIIIIEKENREVVFAEGQLKIEYTNKRQPAAGNRIACLDAGEISFPLILRKWKTGDYFYPLGMKKKKKIARFLIDLKLSKSDKEKVWVIESNKRIIWIVGLRLDERFKIMEKTKEVLQLSLHS